MNFETNQGVNCGFSTTQEMSKCIPVSNGPIHRWKHSNWSNVDNYGNFMVPGSKDLSLLPNRVPPTSPISISPNFAEPIKNMCPQSSPFCTILHVSPSSTLDPQMQLLQPARSSSAEYMMPQTQTMSPVLLQGENLAAYQRYEGQQVMNGGHSELLGDIIGTSTFDWATGHTVDTTRADNIISQQRGLQIQSKQLDFNLNHNNQNAQMDEIFTATEHSQIHGNHSQTNRSITFTLEDETNSSISSIDALHKPRMRWTQQLHDCFVQAINDLGGADKATPKSVQMKMGVKGLTIYHVKSHLQKYRLARYQPDTKEDKRSFISEFTNRSATPEKKESEPSKKSAPESEALRLQWELQKSLHDQLEFQRELQLRAEENARQLQKLLEEQKKVGEAFMLASQSFCSTNPAATSGPSSTRLELAQDQLNDRRNDASLRNDLHKGNEDMLELGVRLSPASPKKSRVEIGTSTFRY
ncbi:hypothetical protein MKX01_033974 [Papaver californicum]|nr:hypothetical protein MKX01_033974 [Papaver californicum]